MAVTPKLFDEKSHDQSESRLIHYNFQHKNHTHFFSTVERYLNLLISPKNTSCRNIIHADVGIGLVHKTEPTII